MEQFAYLFISLGLLAIWATIFLFLNSRERKESVISGVLAGLLGLTEPFFVPEYWNPLTLFDLARTTGFDIESLIFMFAVGGITASVYEVFFHPVHQHIERLKKSGAYNLRWAEYVGALLLFIALSYTTDINPIYTSISISVFWAIYVFTLRPDLRKKMIFSGIAFGIIYFVAFKALLFFFPNLLEVMWDISAISGILLFSMPLEEVLFAVGIGFLWSGVYDYLFWYRLKKEPA